MVITFRDIKQDNFYECMRLSVRKDQPFVASNAFSVAESKIFPFWITKAIYADEQMAGFLMYENNFEEKELYSLCIFSRSCSHNFANRSKTSAMTSNSFSEKFAINSA